MKVFKTSIYFIFSGLLLTSCMTGKYVSEPTGERTISQAPMKLRTFGRAQYTYYAYSNSAVEMYQENARFRKKGDTIYMRTRTYYGDTNDVSKDYFPQYVVMGDSLVSLQYDMAYVKKKK